MEIKLQETEYSLRIKASKGELQELSYAVEKYIEEEHYTSGDSPTWEFMKELANTLERI